VLRVLSDVLTALDSGNLVMLTLLDLSAAFDSVDRNILLCRLQTSYGLGGLSSLRLLCIWLATLNVSDHQHPVPNHQRFCMECHRIPSWDVLLTLLRARRTGHHQAWLLLFNVVWCVWNTAAEITVCAERRRSTSVLGKEIGTHNSSSPATSLVKSSGENQIPVVRSGPSLPP